MVGTLLALLVFLAIFGVFLTQYLPLWMAENEETLAVTVASEFGQIDHTLDLQYIDQSTSFAASNAVTMTSNYVPVFSQPTYGTLSFGGSEPYPQSLWESVTFHQSSATAWQTANYSTGSLSMALHNRYYVPITYELEQGAVISSQNASQQTMIFSPSFIASASGSNSTLDLTMFATYGNTSSATSVATQEVYTQFVASQTMSGISGGTPVFLNFSTYFPCAWSTFWNNTLTSLNQSSYPAASIGTGMLLNPLPYHSSAAITKHTELKACTPTGPTDPQEVHLYFPDIINFNLGIGIFNVIVGSQVPT